MLSRITAILKYSKKEVQSMYIQQSLSGKVIESLKVYVSNPLPMAIEWSHPLSITLLKTCYKIINTTTTVYEIFYLA